MDRKRSLIAAGTIAGVALLGGTALAGAEGDSSSETDRRVEQVDDRVAGSGEEVETEEVETEAVDRRATVGDDAELQSADDDEGGDDRDDDVRPLGGNEGDDVSSHGQAVSETARTTEPGPGHGEAVSEVARSNAGNSDHDPGDDAEVETTESADTETADTEETDDSDDTVDSDGPARPEQSQDHAADKG